MTLSVGIVGLPNAGKSTLFNAITKAAAAVASYPFTTIEPNIGVVVVPDARLDQLAGIVRPEKIVPATVEFVDIAGLVEGASHGEGLGNQFLGHIRNVDAVAVVLRCFDDPDVSHVYGEIDPLRDARVLATELALADLATIQRRVERARSASKGGEKRALREVSLLSKLEAHVNAGEPARTFVVDPEDADFSREIGISTGLLTAKPVLYVANVGESDLSSAVAEWAEGTPLVPSLPALRGLARSEGAELVPVSAKLEAELHELVPEEAAAYLASIGVRESGIDRLIRACYRLLDLITFFTVAGGREVHAWAIQRGAKALQAAGKVHSDMERGFIRAEVIGVAELALAGSWLEARDKGLLRLEGRDYVVRDGDVLHFRFAV